MIKLVYSFIFINNSMLNPQFFSGQMQYSIPGEGAQLSFCYKCADRWKNGAGVLRTVRRAWTGVSRATYTRLRVSWCFKVSKDWMNYNTNISKIRTTYFGAITIILRPITPLWLSNFSRVVMFFILCPDSKTVTRIRSKIPLQQLLMLLIFLRLKHTDQANMVK